MATTTTKKAIPAKRATTAKHAAKKTTAAKPAAKKTTSTKLATKKNTVAKPAVKKATSMKTAVELSVTVNKKIAYLRLKICYSYARQAEAKGESISGIDVDKTLASVRRGDSSGDISISGNKKIKTLEKEFDTAFGLYAQVCYTAKDGHRYYTSGSADEMTLAAFNKKCESDGCQKGVWK